MIPNINSSGNASKLLLVVATTRSSFEALPDELILGIMMLLGFKQWMVLACVSSKMRKVSRDNDLWKRYFPSFDPTKSKELLYPKVYDVFKNKYALGQEHIYF